MNEDIYDGGNEGSEGLLPFDAINVWRALDQWMIEDARLMPSFPQRE